MPNHLYKLAVFLIGVFSTLSSIGMTITDGSDHQINRKIQFSTSQNDSPEHFFKSADQNHPSTPQSPFSNDYGAKLELEEEDIYDEHPAITITYSKSYSTFFTHAQFINRIELFSPLSPHPAIYILFEVFRL